MVGGDHRYLNASCLRYLLLLVEIQIKHPLGIDSQLLPNQIRCDMTAVYRAVAPRGRKAYVVVAVEMA